MNDHLENELREALRKVDAPAGFTERVIARSREENRTAVFTRPRSRRWTWAAAASMAACLTLSVGLIQYRGRIEERQRGQEAKQELMQAMRITGSTLRLAQEKVRHWNE